MPGLGREEWRRSRVTIGVEVGRRLGCCMRLCILRIYEDRDNGRCGEMRTENELLLEMVQLRRVHSELKEIPWALRVSSIPDHVLDNVDRRVASVSSRLEI